MRGLRYSCFAVQLQPSRKWSEESSEELWKWSTESTEEFMEMEGGIIAMNSSAHGYIMNVRDL